MPTLIYVSETLKSPAQKVSKMHDSCDEIFKSY